MTKKKKKLFDEEGNFLRKAETEEEMKELLEEVERNPRGEVARTLCGALLEPLKTPWWLREALTKKVEENAGEDLEEHKDGI